MTGLEGAPRRTVIGAELRMWIAGGDGYRAEGSLHALNVHVAGVVVMLAGVLGLVLSLGRRPPEQRQLSRWLRTAGDDNPGRENIKEAAAAEVAAVQQNDKFFSPDAR